MKSYRVVWRAKARDDLLDLYLWIAERAGDDTAIEYTGRVEAFASELATFPLRGTPRDDLHLGLRTRPYRRRTVVAYCTVEDRVEIMRLFHGGRDWEFADIE